MLSSFNWDFKACEKLQLEVNRIIAKNRDWKFNL